MDASVADNNNLLIKITEAFVNYSDINKALNRTLFLLAQFTKCDRAVILRIKDNKIAIDYEWYSEGIEADRDFYRNISPNVFQGLDVLLEQNNALVVSDIEQIAQYSSEGYRVLKQRGVKSFIAVPLFVHNKHWGFLSVSYLKKKAVALDRILSQINIVAKIVSIAIRGQKNKEALNESETKFKHLVNSLGEGIVYCDSEDTILVANQAFAKITGYSIDELLGAKIYRILLPEDEYHLIKSKTEARLKQGEEESYQLRIKRKDGSRRWVRVTASAVKDSKGRVIATLGAISDINEIKQYQDRLYHIAKTTSSINRENLYPNLTRISTNILNADGCIVAILGKDQHKFKSAYFLNEDLMPNNQELIKLLNEIYKLKDKISNNEGILIPFSIEGITLRYNFKYLYVSLLNSKVYGYLGVVIIFSNSSLHLDRVSKNLLSIVYDRISAELIREKMEVETLSLHNQLVNMQKMEAIGQMAAGLAHDLNNSLSAIAGHLELIKQDFHASDSIKRSVDIALIGCSKATALIESLLKFTKGGDYRFDLINIANVIRETLELIRSLIPEEIEINIVTKTGDVEIIGDSNKLQQVFTNIILNAVQVLGREGNIKIVIDKTEENLPQQHNIKAVPGEYVVVAIEDNGPGIDDSDIVKVFQPFYTSNKGNNNLGLGLSIAYGIVQRHRGWIALQSSKGKGSCFSIFLPLKLERKDSGNIIYRDKHSTIMVVDDEEILVNLAVQFLENDNYRAKGFTDPFLALSWYKKHYREVSLVILDMKMPTISGQKLFFELKKINNDVQVILLSGYVKDDGVRLVLENGGVKFFSKPIQYSELLSWINNYFKTHTIS